MTFRIFTKPDCKICTKAKDALDRLRVPYDPVSVDPTSYDLTQPEQVKACMTAMADAAWFGFDTDYPPLVVAVDEQDKALKTWTGRDVADPDNSWLVAVRAWLTGQIVVIETEPPEPPTGLGA